MYLLMEWSECGFTWSEIVNTVLLIVTGIQSPRGYRKAPWSIKLSDQLELT